MAKENDDVYLVTIDVLTADGIARFCHGEWSYAHPNQQLRYNETQTEIEVYRNDILFASFRVEYIVGKYYNIDKGPKKPKKDKG